jgi:hypothetical protein
MYGALNQGWGDLDFSVLFKNYTPTEAYDELPALDHNFEQAEPAAEPPPEEEKTGEPEPEPEPEPPAASEEAVENGQTQPAGAEVAEVPAVHGTSSPASAAPDATNSAPMRETVPTEEAARIIEAVLAHVAGQRAEVGTSVEEEPAMTPMAPKTDEPSLDGQNAQLKEAAKTEPTEKLPSSPAAVPPATTPTELPKPVEAAKPAPGAPASEPMPQNFVRRWFVGR